MRFVVRCQISLSVIDTCYRTVGMCQSIVYESGQSSCILFHHDLHTVRFSFTSSDIAIQFFIKQNLSIILKVYHILHALVIELYRSLNGILFKVSEVAH